jgi:hypothetical protein
MSPRVLWRLGTADAATARVAKTTKNFMAVSWGLKPEISDFWLLYTKFYLCRFKSRRGEGGGTVVMFLQKCKVLSKHQRQVFKTVYAPTEKFGPTEKLAPTGKFAPN